MQHIRFRGAYEWEEVPCLGYHCCEREARKLRDRLIGEYLSALVPGTRKATVLPEPVGASTTTSLLDKSRGMTIFCTGAMYLNLRDSSAWRVKFEREGRTEVKGSCER